MAAGQHAHLAGSVLGGRGAARERFSWACSRAAAVCPSAAVLLLLLFLNAAALLHPSPLQARAAAVPLSAAQREQPALPHHARPHHQGKQGVVSRGMGAWGGTGEAVVCSLSLWAGGGK